jgi:cytochrome c biogenesis factor
MFATVFLLSVTMLLVLLILLTATEGTVSPDEYHGRSAIFVVPLMAFLIICMAARTMDKRRATMAAGASLVAGLVAWAINPGGLDPGVVWFGAVIGMFGIAIIVTDGAKLVMRNLRNPRRILRRVGSNVLHLGLAMVFMAYCLSNITVAPEVIGVTDGDGESVDLDEVSILVQDRVWEENTGVQTRGEDWDSFTGKVVVTKDGEAKAEGTFQVISSWQYRELGTLTYREGGEAKAIDGEVVDKRITSSETLVKVQSLSDPMLSAVTDLRFPNSDISPWPALFNEMEILTGDILRISDDVNTWEGFLVSVEALRGNVTMVVDGEEVVIPGPSVQKLWRKAYVSLAITDVFVHSTVLKDTYVTVLSAHPLEDGTFSARIMVSEVPAMFFLWLGMYLMSAGVLLRPLERLGARREKDNKGDDGAALEDVPSEDETEEET